MEDNKRETSKNVRDERPSTAGSMEVEGSNLSITTGHEEKKGGKRRASGDRTRMRGCKVVGVGAGVGTYLMDVWTGDRDEN